MDEASLNYLSYLFPISGDREERW